MSSKITYNFIGDKQGCTIVHEIFNFRSVCQANVCTIQFDPYFQNKTASPVEVLFRIENHNFCSTNSLRLLFFFNEISGMARVTREERDTENRGRLLDKKGGPPRFFGFSISEVHVIPTIF